MDPSLVLSICQVAAVAVIPLIIWGMGNAYQKREAKIRAKRELFFTLMRNRKTFLAPKEKVDALNLIDVVYQDDKKVRQAWKDYLDALNANSPHFNNSNAYLLDLLSEMAVSLGYKELKQTEIDRFYEPQASVDDASNQRRIIAEMMRILVASKSFSEARSEEEINDATRERDGRNFV